MNDARVLRAVRLVSVAAGSAALLLAMTVWAESPAPRDLSWTLGVALLVLSLVANRLLRQSENRSRRDGGNPGGGPVN